MGRAGYSGPYMDLNARGLAEELGLIGFGEAGLPPKTTNEDWIRRLTVEKSSKLIWKLLEKVEGEESRQDDEELENWWM
jgi:hypothetical protein